MKTYHCYFDGCCEPQNPNGNMGMGVYVIEQENKFEWSQFLPEKVGNTNNIAEYLALIKVLELVGNKKNDCIHIYGDSKLVIMQMQEMWRIMDGLYVPYAVKALELIKEIRKANTVILHWIPREKNQKADDLSKAHLKKVKT